MTNKFKPIFAATITPGASIEHLTSKTGTAYIKMPDASYTHKGETTQRMAMAFGKSAAAIGSLLETGKAVELAVQLDNGTVKIIGLPTAKAA